MRKKGGQTVSKKSIAVLLSVIATVAAAVTAVIVFRKQIEELMRSLGKKKDQAPAPEFTPEEVEVFADI